MATSENMATDNADFELYSLFNVEHKVWCFQQKNFGVIEFNPPHRWLWLRAGPLE